MLKPFINKMVVVASLVFPLICSGQGVLAETGDEKFVEKIVSGITIGSNYIRNARSLIGPGTPADTPENPGICYIHPKTFEVMKIEYDKKTEIINGAEIEADSKLACAETVEEFPPFITGKGIKLGMDLKKVVEAYGKPQLFLIDALTTEEILYVSINHSDSFIPENDLENDSYYIRVEIPQELSDDDFLIAYGKPESIVGVHKKVIYSYHSSHNINSGSEKKYEMDLHFYKGKLNKIRIREAD